uniref:Uncharacterized protein n=1 Tax=Oryza punctata TaxID=4537 RepID=A0A0E0JKE2_ORYPU
MVQRCDALVGLEMLPEENIDVVHCLMARTSFRRASSSRKGMPGTSKERHTTYASSTRLHGEGLLKVEDDDVLDIGIHDVPIGLGSGAREEEADVRPREVVVWSDTTSLDGEGWPEVDDGDSATGCR